MTVSTAILTERISVVVIDDHQAFSDAFGLALDMEADLSCVGAATTLDRGFELVSKLRPAVVLMDQVLPDGDGVSATSRIRESFPETRVVLITDHEGATIALATLEPINKEREAAAQGNDRRHRIDAPSEIKCCSLDYPVQ